MMAAARANSPPAHDRLNVQGQVAHIAKNFEPGGSQNVS
jgi:hypothetical protein